MLKNQLEGKTNEVKNIKNDFIKKLFNNQNVLLGVGIGVILVVIINF